MPHSMCGSGARWCARADAIFDVPGMHVLDVEVDDQQRLVLTVESGQLAHGCPSCGVLAVGHGRRVRLLHDAPCFGRVTLVRWLVRIWRCREPGCPTGTFSEAHDVAPPRTGLTVRAVRWAVDALSYDDTTVSALARHLGVDWHTAWNAIEVEANARVSDPQRLAGVKTLGVDEHIWRPSRIGVDRAVTIMVDLTGTRTDASTPASSMLSSAGPAPSTNAGSRSSPTGSSPASSTPRWTRSADMRTRSATGCPTRSPSSTRSMSCGWAPRLSTRSAAGFNKTPWAAGAEGRPALQDPRPAPP